MIVHVSAGGLLDPVDVTIDNGQVTLDDKVIGRVRKATRSYSPPISRGSPIARYHKTINCWAIIDIRGASGGLRFDTRQDAIRYLVVESRR